MRLVKKALANIKGRFKRPFIFVAVKPALGGINHFFREENFKQRFKSGLVYARY